MLRGSAPQACLKEVAYEMPWPLGRSDPGSETGLPHRSQCSAGLRWTKSGERPLLWRGKGIPKGQKWPQREKQVPQDSCPLGQLCLSNLMWPLSIPRDLSFLPSQYSGPGCAGTCAAHGTEIERLHSCHSSSRSCLHCCWSLGCLNRATAKARGWPGAGRV